LPGLGSVGQLSGYDSNSPKIRTSVCPAGQRVLGAGWSAGDFSTYDQVINSSASITADGTGVTGIVSEDSTGYSGSWPMASIAVCATR